MDYYPFRFVANSLQPFDLQAFYFTFVLPKVNKSAFPAQGNFRAQNNNEKFETPACAAKPRPAYTPVAPLQTLKGGVPPALA
jgi:hypothetical protein